MTPTILSLPIQGEMAEFLRFSVAEYHRLIESDVLAEDDDLELYPRYQTPFGNPVRETLERILF